MALHAVTQFKKVIIFFENLKELPAESLNSLPYRFRALSFHPFNICP